MATTLVRMRLSLGPLGRLIGCVFIVFIVYKKIDNKQEYRFIFELESSKNLYCFGFSGLRILTKQEVLLADYVYYVDDFQNYNSINLILFINSRNRGEIQDERFYLRVL